MSTLVVINPSSGSKKAVKIIDKLKTILLAHRLAKLWPTS
jgi:hypothetical protein